MWWVLGVVGVAGVVFGVIVSTRPLAPSLRGTEDLLFVWVIS